MSDQYVDMLKTYLFEPLVRACPHLGTIQIIYDAHNELAPRANENVTVLYDFDDRTQNRFMLDVSMTLIAAYSLSNSTSRLTQREVRCKDQFLQLSQSMIHCLSPRPTGKYPS